MSLTEIRLSASSIYAYKSCPTRYLLNYIYGLQPLEDKDAFRIGTNWHRCHEVLEMIPQGKCPDCFKREELRDSCPLCEGTGRLPSDMMEAVIRVLNKMYATIPDNKTRDEWEAERTKILYSLSGYRWNFHEQYFETIADEIKFELPVRNPDTGRPLGRSVFVGRVDRLVRDKRNGLLYVFERKSTSKKLDDTKYWSRLENDDQVTGNLYGMRMAQLRGDLEQYGIRPDDPLIEGVYYDVWHKPGISPKFLTQGDSKAFLESGEYCGEKFERETVVAEDGVEQYMINGVHPIINPGKKEGTFAILETQEMYGARLLQDITQNPSVYYAQRPIARDDGQLLRFEEDLVKLTKIIRHIETNDLWVDNSYSCSSPFKCDYYSLCHPQQCIGPDDVPDGFRKYVRGKKK